MNISAVSNVLKTMHVLLQNIDVKLFYKDLNLLFNEYV